jgi:hypothetical protein
MTDGPLTIHAAEVCPMLRLRPRLSPKYLLSRLDARLAQPGVRGSRSVVLYASPSLVLDTKILPHRYQ